MELHIPSEVTEILSIAEMSYTQFMRDYESYCNSAGLIICQETLNDYIEHLKIFYM